MGTNWKQRWGGLSISLGLVLAACSDDGVPSTPDESTGTPDTGLDTNDTLGESTAVTNPTDTVTTDPSATTDTATEPTTGPDPSGPGSSSDATTTGTASATESSSSSDGSSSDSGSSDSSSSGGSSDGSSSGVASEETSGFIDPTGDPQFECDVWAQDCPDGEKCMPWSNNGTAWNALRCTPLDPNPAGVGEECIVEESGVSGIDNCELGAMCWDVDAETNQGTCVSMCTGSVLDPSCPDPTEYCSIANEGVLTICLPGCDPLLQDCADDEVCIAVAAQFLCAPDASGEVGAANDPCEFLNVCDPGLSCLEAELVPGCFGASGCCSPYCDFTDGGATADCVAAIGAGVECLPFYGEGLAPPGYEDVGVCAFPA